MIALILVLLAGDAYRTIPLSALATTSHTHVCIVAPVVYVRLQQDGDIHVTVAEGAVKAVLEIIPQIPLPRPRKGTTIRACGITRYDKQHRWAEIHPVTSWELRR